MMKQDQHSKPEEQALQPGYHVEIMRWIPWDSLEKESKSITNKINRIVNEALAAGYKTDMKSVSYSGEAGNGRIVILYELSNDPSFRPPM